MTSRLRRRRCQRCPGFRGRPAASTPWASLTSNSAWALTNGSTSEWLVGEPVHWLAGRLAIVTGASRGIGAATAAALAAAGAHVVLAARDATALAGVATRIEAGGGKATPVRADVSQAGDVERLFAAAAERGHVAALVCAAGV